MVEDNLLECLHHPCPPLRKRMSYWKYPGLELVSSNPAHAAASALETGMNDSSVTMSKRTGHSLHCCSPHLLRLGFAFSFLLLLHILLPLLHFLKVPHVC